MTPPRNRAWVWYFVVLALLTVTAIAVPVWYNLSQQLSREELDRAEARWEANRPADYDLEYTQKGGEPAAFLVQVRGHQVRSVSASGRPLPPGSYPFDDMTTLFRFIRARLEEDRQPGNPRTFTVATFSAADGHVVRYVRNVGTRRERLEITVQLHRVPAAPQNPATAPPAALPGRAALSDFSYTKTVRLPA
jgi:hypothetical protein